MGGGTVCLEISVRGKNRGRLYKPILQVVKVRSNKNYFVLASSCILLDQYSLDSVVTCEELPPREHLRGQNSALSENS